MLTVHADIDRIIISREQIAKRIKELGAQIRSDLARDAANGEVVVVPILTGAIIFVADLIRELPLKMKTSVVTVSSYPGATVTSKGAQIAGAIPGDLAGKHVLIVDDILDSGGTIRLIREEVAKRQPASMRCCVLLRKQIPSAMDTPCEYVGFDIPDEFVVGYGLDYDNLYRNLPEIGVLKEDAR